MSQERSTSTYTLGAALERDRLEHRLGRVAVAIAALRQLASEHGRELGAPPSPVRQALADFEAQVEAINARLLELALDRRGKPSFTTANPVSRWSGPEENGR